MKMENQGKQRLEPETPEFQVIDKRHFVNLDQIDIDKEALPVEKPRYPSYVEELMSKMAETERRFQEKKKQIDEEINRTKARLEADFDRKLGLEKQQIVLPFLEVLDNLQRAIDTGMNGSTAHLIKGIEMTTALFRSKLQSIGVEPVSVLDQAFDPNLAQAVGVVKVEDSSRDGVIVEEVQTGYTLNGQLLRPAQVRVGRLE